MIITFSDSSRGRLWDGQKWRKEAHIRTGGIVLANPTFSKIPLISVCLICVIQELFYVKKGNYLEFVWRCRFGPPTRR